MAARKEYTAQQYAQLLVEKLEKDFPTEAKELESGGVQLTIKGCPGSACKGPMGISEGTFRVMVYADGSVRVMYELYIPYDAQHSYELLKTLNQINGICGVTYSVSGDSWNGVMLRARDEFHIDRFAGAFAGKVANRVLMAAADIHDVLWDLETAMPEFFGAEALAQAMAEANLSPENLLRLPEVCEAPPEAEAAGDDLSEDAMPEWYAEWGDEQKFLEGFINAPVDQMSGSELIMLNVALQRDICRSQKRYLEAVRQARTQRPKED